MAAKLRTSVAVLLGSLILTPVQAASWFSDEEVRKHGRTDRAIYSYTQGGARYALGVRYSF